MDGSSWWISSGLEKVLDGYIVDLAGKYEVY